MNKTTQKIAAIVVAGGTGSRARQTGQTNLPKQYQSLAGRTVLYWSLNAFLKHPEVDVVLPVISHTAADLYAGTAGLIDSAKLMKPVFGGDTRQASVRNGLEALLAENVSMVLIHDAARPFVSFEIIDGILSKLARHQGAVTGVRQADTLKKSGQDSDIIEETIPRDELWSVQTPQGFDYQLIRALHEKYHLHNVTDDAALCELAGIPVALCSGSSRNFKITRPEDFELAEKLMSSTNYEFRTGQGFDVHRFEPGDSVTLCGVQVPHTHSLKGHSDADVAMHALTDAILGALAEGDIGTHFPPSDSKWKNATSDIFLSHACDLMDYHKGVITHCDITIICESPKIGPHRDAMIARLAEIMGIAANRISVKATTTEQLGFTGRKEGISALATATVRLPERGARS